MKKAYFSTATASSTVLSTVTWGFALTAVHIEFASTILSLLWIGSVMMPTRIRLFILMVIRIRTKLIKFRQFFSIWYLCRYRTVHDMTAIRVATCIVTIETMNCTGFKYKFAKIMWYIFSRQKSRVRQNYADPTAHGSPTTLYRYFLWQVDTVP
jgi:hypothetical protein